ncbi:MAG: preprotein translocase subunit YajC [Actinomycetota bacterium]
MQGGLENLIFLGLLIAIFYFMLIRPQKRRVEQHRRLLESISLGDEVVTMGGLFGTVRALREDEIELEIAPKTKIRIVKSAIARKVEEEVEDETAEEETS